MKQYKVHYAMIPARQIFGMVGRCGGGYNTQWTDWSEKGRAAREQIMHEFEEGLNAICGHYEKLEKSILAEGIRNPITITCGYPRKRSMQHLPPELRSKPANELLLLETTTGGSRLHVCQKHNFNVPCIVTDWTGRFAKFPEIKNEREARSYYKDQPKSVMFSNTLGLVEGFDLTKVGYHLGGTWSEDKIMPQRAVLWITLMNKYGYVVDNLPKNVLAVLAQHGIKQPTK